MSRHSSQRWTKSRQVADDANPYRDIQFLPFTNKFHVVGSSGVHGNSEGFDTLEAAINYRDAKEQRA